MRVTHWGEYGIHCAVFLAKKHDEGRGAVGATEIAEAQGIDTQYAQQVLQRLRKGSIIESIRGPKGGYRLARAAEDINIREVLIAAEGHTFEIICDNKPLDERRCDDHSPCYLRGFWYDLREQVDEFLSAHTLSSLAKQSTSSQDLIQISSPQ